MKTRVISAIVMCLVIIPILFIGGLPFKILAIVLAMMSMYEIMKARSKKSEINILKDLITVIIYFMRIICLFRNERIFCKL